MFVCLCLFLRCVCCAFHVIWVRVCTNSQKPSSLSVYLWMHVCVGVCIHAARRQACTWTLQKLEGRLQNTCFWMRVSNVALYYSVPFSLHTHARIQTHTHTHAHTHTHTHCIHMSNKSVQAVSCRGPLRNKNGRILRRCPQFLGRVSQGVFDALLRWSRAIWGNIRISLSCRIL